MRNKKRIIFSLIFVIAFVVLITIAAKNFKQFDYESVDGLLQTTIKAYHSQSDSLLRKCYKKDRKEIQTDAEINFEKKFFLSVDARKVQFYDSQIVLKKSDYMYADVSFDFILGNGEKIPYYQSFVVYKEKDGSYKVVTKNDCPRAVIDYFNEHIGESVQSKLYESYEIRENKHKKQNPGYADEVYKRMIVLKNGIPVEMKENLRYLGIIFLIAMAELWILCLVSYKIRIKNGYATKKYFSNKIKGRKIIK